MQNLSVYICFSVYSLLHELVSSLLKLKLSCRLDISKAATARGRSQCHEPGTGFRDAWRTFVTSQRADFHKCIFEFTVTAAENCYCYPLSQTWAVHSKGPLIYKPNYVNDLKEMLDDPEPCLLLLFCNWRRVCEMTLQNWKRRKKRTLQRRHKYLTRGSWTFLLSCERVSVIA